MSNPTSSPTRDNPRIAGEGELDRSKLEEESQPSPIGHTEYKIYCAFAAGALAMLANVVCFSEFELERFAISTGSAMAGTFILTSLYQWYKNSKGEPWEVE